MNKMINSRCVCKNDLSQYNKEIVVVLPCEHLFHKDCAEYSVIRYGQCPVCKHNVRQLLTHKDIKYRLKDRSNPNYEMYKQIHLDMTSVSKQINENPVSVMTIPNTLFKSKILINYLSVMATVKSSDDLHNLFINFIKAFKININVINPEKINNSVKKIVISNHITYLDPIVIFATLGCGFLSSTMVNDSVVSQNILDIMPILIIKRGHSTNTVEKIKEYVKKKDSICIFPEGIFTHANTLSQFRKGAFSTGYPVQPIVIKYNPIIYNHSYARYIMQFLSADKIDVDIIVLDLEYPPFTAEKIENIRLKMAKAGNLSLSRISNKDVVDK